MKKKKLKGKNKYDVSVKDPSGSTCFRFDSKEERNAFVQGLHACRDWTKYSFTKTVIAKDTWTGLSFESDEN